ncbi:MAG: tetratricopeptide repeat protein [Methanoregula sp.]
MQFRILVLTAVVALMAFSPVLAAETTDQANNPWYWYNEAVDLANAGRFTEALQANEKALAINQSIPVAWANEAGILVQLGRYEDAIRAADTVLSVNNSEMPNTYAAAYYSKADALLALGRTEEAKTDYMKAYELDSTLVPPMIISGAVSPLATTSPAVSQGPASAAPSVPSAAPTTAPTTARSPVPVMVILGALFIAFSWCRYCRSE